MARLLSEAAPAIRRNILPALAAVLFFTACMVWRVDQFLDRSAPLEFIDGRVIPAEPKLSDTFTIAWDVVRKRQCRGTTHRTLIDAAGYAHTIAATESLSRSIISVEGKVRRVGRTFRFPATMQLTDADGTEHASRFLADIHFVCHPWQQYWPIIVRLPEVRFTVKP